MKTIGIRLMGAAVGFLVGCLFLLILYYLLQGLMELFDVSRARFRVPIAIFVLPLITAFIGLKAGPDLFVLVQHVLGDTGPWARLLLVGPVFWALVVIAYVFVFEPFGYRVSEDEWLFVSKIILFPTAVLWSGAWVLKRFVFQK